MPELWIKDNFKNPWNLNNLEKAKNAHDLIKYVWGTEKSNYCVQS